MNADRLRSFRFSTAKQWNSCLFVQADDQTLQAHRRVQPFGAYDRHPTLFESSGAHAPAVTPAGEIIWHDDHGCFYRLSVCDDAPQISPAPLPIANARRMVTSSDALWVQGEPPESLQRYEEETLTRVLTVDLASAHVIDISVDGPYSVVALVERDDTYQVVRVDSAGYVVKTVALSGISGATACVFLRSSKRFVVLADCDYQQRVYWFSLEEEKSRSTEARSPLFSRAVAAMHPCFKADVLGSDGRERVFLAGADDKSFGSSYILILDADGNPLGDVPIDTLDAPATGIATTRDALLVTGARGLLRFATAQVVPDGAGQMRCIVMTPMLNAPDREDRRRWLRIDAAASLPEGSTLEITYAATDEAEVRDRLSRIAADRSATPSQRLTAMLNEPDIWRTSTRFLGSGTSKQGEADPFSAKLFDVSEPYVWVSVTLTAAAGARLPNLSKLDVWYPGRTLMESLPAIYQREEERPDSFLRSLVGVLEATTQGLDARIGSLGSYLDPSTSPEPWLDFVTQWLGVPWDDGMSIDQKRRIAARAATLARGRGTREGLEALLEALIAGPRRFRITDTTADFGFATVGGKACAGSALPAMLGGHTRLSTELGSSAVLGYMRLPCPGHVDDGVWQLTGRILIEIAATAMERKAWEPWLAAVVGEMVPLMARVQIRWVPAQALRSNRLDGTMTLDSAPAPHLGTDAVTSWARLPERGARISTSGPSISTRLR